VNKYDPLGLETRSIECLVGPDTGNWDSQWERIVRRTIERFSQGRPANSPNQFVIAGKLGKASPQTITRAASRGTAFVVAHGVLHHGGRDYPTNMGVLGVVDSLNSNWRLRDGRANAKRMEQRLKEIRAWDKQLARHKRRPGRYAAPSGKRLSPIELPYTEEDITSARVMLYGSNGVPQNFWPSEIVDGGSVPPGARGRAVLYSCFGGFMTGTEERGISVLMGHDMKRAIKYAEAFPWIEQDLARLLKAHPSWGVRVQSRKGGR